MEIKSKNPLVSVIVPVYNAEKFIDRCIKSVINQTYQKWELLLVDDGSDDMSLSICRSYAAINSNIFVFHKANGGVSSARNFALKEATGEIVTFVDADDWIRSNYLQRAVDNILTHKIDLYQVSLQKKEEFKLCDYNSIDETHIIKPLSTNQFVASNFNVCIGGTFMKMDIIHEHKISFEEGLKLAEDQIFIYTYLYFCNQCAASSDLDYCYYANSNSATKSSTASSYRDSIISLSRFKYRYFLPKRISLTILSQLVNYIRLAEHDVSNSEIYEVVKAEKFPLSLLKFRMSKSHQIFLIISAISRRLAIAALRILTNSSK